MATLNHYDTKSLNLHVRETQIPKPSSNFSIFNFYDLKPFIFRIDIEVKHIQLLSMFQGQEHDIVNA